MVVSRNSFTLFIAFCIFFQLFIPSIKLIWSSSILNAISISALFSCCLISNIRLNKIKIEMLFLWLIFSIVLIAMFFWKDAVIGNDVYKLIYMLLVVAIIILITDEHVVQPFCGFVYFWSLFVSVWQLTLGIYANYALGQTYLTVALPIGVGLTVSLVNIFISNTTLKKRFIFLGCAIFQISALGTLLSRAAITFPFLILVVIYTIWVFLSSTVSVLYKFFITFLSTVLIVVMIFNIEHILNDRQLQRIERLGSLKEEPRYEVYSRAIQLIKESPIMGYGTASTAKVFNGTYPHNIFLDVFLNGGLGLFFPFLLILIIYFKLTIPSLKWKVMTWEHLSLISISMFLFLQWNISFGLDTIYIPMSSIMICSIFISCRGSHK